MFRDRLIYEGREEELTSETRKFTKQGYKHSTAVTMAMKAMTKKNRGPYPLKKEREMWSLRQQAEQQQIKDHYKPVDRDLVAEAKEEFSSRPEYPLALTGLPPDVAWVYTNYYKVQGLKQEEWPISPADAPSAGSWGMLLWAAGNPDKFYDKVVAYQIKSSEKSSEEEEDKVSEVDRMAMSKIRKMIEGL